MGKVIKVIFYALAIILLLILIAAPIFVVYKRNNLTANSFNHFNEAKNLSFVNIKWVSSTIGEKLVEKTAFFVPVKIKGLKGNLYMQFDTGAGKTLLYGKILCEVNNPKAKIKKVYGKDSTQYFKNFEINIGTTKLNAERIQISPTMGELITDSSFIIIGTLGFDSFYDRTLILDFKNDLLAITQKTANELDYKLNYVKNASIKKYPLLLPTRLGNKKIRLFYDTGSSMFSLLTSNKRLNKINESPADTICCISAWGKKYPVHRKPLAEPITIGNNTFENQDVYGCELLDAMNYAPKRLCYGITGNRMFDNTIVVIDRKENKFGIEQ